MDHRRAAAVGPRLCCSAATAVSGCTAASKVCGGGEADPQMHGGGSGGSSIFCGGLAAHGTGLISDLRLGSRFLFLVLKTKIIKSKLNPVFVLNVRQKKVVREIWCRIFCDTKQRLTEVLGLQNWNEETNLRVLPS
ncbi:hypothetical protein EJB05_28528 [Eragrostis curvula]|uniref:Uncharacterized protein n=1 Tax=Eragrostis curvula TaxID=38414 RepID=A0A5J9URK2_9POAL|nr:hypothetical protein EJB05_28528 [Eragrostis curvula]